MKKFLLSVLVIFLFMIDASPQAKFSISGNLCVDNSLNFIDETLIPVSNWNWNFGDGTSSSLENPTHSFADTGYFSVILIVTSNGVDYSSSKSILISAPPIVGFKTDSTQVYYSSYSRVFIDTSKSFNPVSKYIWDFGTGISPIVASTESTLYKFPEKGNYSVMLKVVDNKGCSDSVINPISIYNRYYIPNVFTPNGDNLNENFIVTSNGITLFSIEIYSRWGNLVFKRSGHEQIVWDGRMPDGSLVKPGTYYYVISSESGNETYDPEKGFITVFY